MASGKPFIQKVLDERGKEELTCLGTKDSC